MSKSPPESVYLQAKALFDSGQLKKAGNFAYTLLQQYPGDMFLTNMLGSVYVAHNNWPEALKYYRKAVRKEPRNALALYNMAVAQFSVGDIEDARKTLLKALKIDPKNDRIWVFLGMLHNKKMDYEQAISCYRKALEANPGSIEAASGLMSELEHTNDLEALAHYLDGFQDRHPNHPVGALFKGLLLARRKDYAPAREVLEQVSFSLDFQKQERNLEMRRVQVLAQIADKQGRYKEAFDLFARMNDIRKEITPPTLYDTARQQEKMAAHAQYYTPENVGKWDPLSKVADRPAFMIGFPRSGTTLLDTFLRGHKDIEVLEETGIAAAMVQKLGVHSRDTLPLLETLSAGQMQKAAEGYLRAARKLAPGDGVIVDRNPYNTQILGDILRVFPKARVIMAVRDPADVVLSCYMQNFVLNDANALLTNIQDAAKAYDSTMKLWVQYQEVLDFDKTVIRYEDIVNDAAATLPPLVDFLGLEWDPAMLDHQKTAASRERINTASYAQVVQPIYKSALRRWENYAELMPEALEILTPWRAYFGYV